MKVPTTDTQANDLLRRAGEIEIEMAGCKAEVERALLKMRRAYNELTRPLVQEHRAIHAALHGWYQAIQGNLGEKKIVTLTFGRLGVRPAKPALEFAAEATEETVIAALVEGPQDLLEKFVRAHLELNGPAIHDATQEDLDRLLELGVRLKRSEKFFIAPDASASRK